MRARLFSSSIVLAGLLSACAAPGQPVMPQVEQRSGPMTIVKPFESGNVADGTYRPSSAEKELDCRHLKGSMLIIIARLKDSANRPRASAPSAAIQSGVTSAKGQPNAMDLDAELQRERARLTAYNGLLAEKKCATLDLAKELAPSR